MVFDDGFPLKKWDESDRASTKVVLCISKKALSDGRREVFMDEKW